mgnify:CR=1 FL=1
MISGRLAGGLGNLMFQIAGIEHIANSSGLDHGYWNTESAFRGLNSGYINPNMKHANDYLTMFKNFHWPKCNKPETEVHVPFHYTPIDIKDNVEYIGYFQSEQYFPNREFILNLFEPSDEVKNYLENKYGDVSNYTSLHVRRTDYVQKAGFHPPCNIEYYEKALSMIQGNVLVFSDDLDWCKETFLGDRFTFISGNRDYQDLFLMSMCKNNIIANSTFSWWGAWLNTNINKKVIAPREWFGPHLRESSDDIYPESWQII